MAKLSSYDINIIINKFTDELVPMQKLSSHFSVSRQTIFKVLKKAGVDTTKHRLPVVCAECLAPILRHRFRVRSTTHHFCNQSCRTLWNSKNTISGAVRAMFH